MPPRSPPYCPAWVTYEGDLADHATAWVATAAPAWETAENAATDADLTYTTAAVPLGVALGASLSGNITTWLGQTVNAEAAYRNAMADHAVTWVASENSAKEALANADLVHAVTYTHTAAGLDVLLAGCISEAMVNWAGTVAGQLTGTTYTPPATTIIWTSSTGTANTQAATAYGATPRPGSNYAYVPDIVENYLIFLNPWSASRPPPVDGWDVAMQRTNKGAIIVGGSAVAAAGGLAGASYLGVSQIGAVGFSSIPAQAAIEYQLVSGAAITLTATVAKHGERVFQTSRQFIDMIVRGFPGRPDPGGAPGAIRWDVPGTFNGSKGVFELVVDSSGRVLHFLFKSNR